MPTIELTPDVAAYAHERSEASIKAEGLEQSPQDVVVGALALYRFVLEQEARGGELLLAERDQSGRLTGEVYSIEHL